ncbi:pyridoxal phosphate-dependent transferase [Pavlovales sp. CCMP2436]|nr:pyridoxal phosphate-dependent transferase [Pavlovales sp. CCMP2436]|mmetsp:Transcript_16051/g.40895  ORF Transcript_16051/g.40895 Transcript_16051/m.40895 type:complete len:465 (-) Transcript_16051:63-1457(-)
MPLSSGTAFSAGLAVGLAGAAAAYVLSEWRRRGRRRRSPRVPAESTIRLMTRLAMQHGAINLSQGFPNEPPPAVMLCSAAGALLAGESAESAAAMATRLDLMLRENLDRPGRRDVLNQYSIPCGYPPLRAQISAHYADYMPSVPADPEENITVVLGATEGFAVTLRALCEPGDAVVFFEPFHELYPSQCVIWGMQPRAVTLRECQLSGEWSYELCELRAALRGARLLLFNSPHNPTGKVFNRVELDEIAALCVELDVMVVTDEIYQFILFEEPAVKHRHYSLATRAGMLERTCIVNAVSKSASATGWRIGWVISPKHLTPAIRACHDQLVVQAPTPLQFGAVTTLALGRKYFDAIAPDYQAKRDVLAAALRAAHFDVLALPQGAYYLFVGFLNVPALKGLSPTQAVMCMIEEHGVACVPGDNFYLGKSKTDPETGGRYLRFAFVRSHDLLQAAITRLKAMPATA